MALKSIEDEWNGFSAMVFAGMKTPPGPVQVQETKQAFFAGAWMMLCAMGKIGSDEVSEQEGVRYLEDRKREGEGFYRDLIRRYAEGN